MSDCPEHGWEHEAKRQAKENAALRVLLFISHGCGGPALYGDDGEMQDKNCDLDFKRQTADEIAAAFSRRGAAKLAAMGATDFLLTLKFLAAARQYFDSGGQGSLYLAAQRARLEEKTAAAATTPPSAG